MRNKCLLIILLWLFFISKIHCNEMCWSSDSECNIKSELFKSVQFSNGISLQIDCRWKLKGNDQDDHLKTDESDFQTSAKNLLLPRFMGIQSVMLDGCQTPLNAPTFGLELLPICANITKASIQHFHMDTLKPLNCSGHVQQLQLEYLNIQFNEMAVIDEHSFPGNYYPHLRELLIEENSLKMIHKNAFKSISSLENLFVINEPMLILKFPDLLQFSSVASVHLETLKRMTSGIFSRLPETLESLYVANTLLDDETVLLINALVLRSLTIRNCSLKNFILKDVHSTVKRIDLSGNVMKTFTAYKNNLKELNLGNNQLTWLPIKWMENLTNLETLILKENQIKELALNTILEAMPKVQTFDLRNNWLNQLQGYETDIHEKHLSQVRLKCDQNPWDCLWLHDFAHYHPEKFRILQYEKFISKINVNGLECTLAIKIAQTQKVPAKTSELSIDKIVNVSAYNLIYPWEYKRSQRAEALIIVFLLPVGVAFLFMLLYMWIYCQKMFHLSYYQGLSCMRPSPNHSSQRFDIVRQLPPRLNQTEPRQPLTRITDEIEEGYEIPINCIMSECNCVMQHNDEIEKCEKSVHITYEHLPTQDPPHQVYEEIIQVGEYDGRTAPLPQIGDTNNAKQTYDHLSFK